MLKGFGDRINALQRQPLMAITGCYRTTSTAAARILAGIAPLSLQARTEFARFRVTALREICVSLAKEVLVPDDFVHPMDVYSIHPARRVSVPFDKELPTGCGTEVFTDGSALAGAVGAAFVVLLYDKHVYSSGGRMSRGNSVFQAELMAILKALEWIVNFCSAGWMCTLTVSPP